MIRYLCFLFASLLLELVNVVVAPIVTMFPVRRMGWSNNRDYRAVDARLPLFLAWFDTPDNDLYGDDGYYITHAPFPLVTKGFKGWVNRWFWLRRNSVYGFKWSVLAAEITADTTLKTFGDVDVKNGQKGKEGWCLIVANTGHWMFRYVRRIGENRCIYLTFGWLLDGFVKRPLLYKVEPKAIFQFEPRLARFG